MAVKRDPLAELRALGPYALPVLEQLLLDLAGLPADGDIARIVYEVDHPRRGPTARQRLTFEETPGWRRALASGRQASRYGARRAQLLADLTGGLSDEKTKPGTRGRPIPGSAASRRHVQSLDVDRRCAGRAESIAERGDPAGPPLGDSLRRKAESDRAQELDPRHPAGRRARRLAGPLQHSMRRV